MPEASRGSWAWLLLSALVVVLDQASKLAVLAHFRLGEEWPLMPVFSLVLAFNAGAAFNFLAHADGWQRPLFLALAALAVAALTWMLRRGGSRSLLFGLALIIGGAIGNAIDRLYLGHVVDFLLVHYDGWFFPAFNVADSAITVGAGLLILDSFVNRHAHPAAASAREENT